MSVAVYGAPPPLTNEIKNLLEEENEALNGYLDDLKRINTPEPMMLYKLLNMALVFKFHKYLQSKNWLGAEKPPGRFSSSKLTYKPLSVSRKEPRSEKTYRVPDLPGNVQRFLQSRGLVASAKKMKALAYFQELDRKLTKDDKPIYVASAVGMTIRDGHGVVLPNEYEA
jgi:hypothetical protein